MFFIFYVYFDLLLKHFDTHCLCSFHSSYDNSYRTASKLNLMKPMAERFLGAIINRNKKEIDAVLWMTLLLAFEIVFCPEDSAV